jgi:hypothetical protein
MYRKYATLYPCTGFVPQAADVEAYQRAERTGEPCREDRHPRDGSMQKPNHDHTETIS